MTTEQVETQRGPQRTRPKPAAWFILGAIVLALFLLVRSCTTSSPYPGHARAVASASTDLGAEVAALRERLGDLERLELFSTMRGWARAAQRHVDRAVGLEPPAEMRLVHGYLVGSLGMRAEALRRLDPAVRNALSDRDLQVVSAQVRGVMRDLVAADRLFALFVEGWPSSAGTRPGASQWASEDLAANEGAADLVRELRDQPALEATYNLAVAKVTVSPNPTGKEGGLDVLPAAATLTVAVVVENSGNQRIPAASVDAVLTSETDPEPRSAEATVPALDPGDTHTVTLRGLRPTVGGPVNLLSVTVGPVGGERNLIDNRFEYKFVTSDD